MNGVKISTVNVANMFKNIPNALIRAQTIQDKIDEITILLEVDKNRYKNEYDALLKNEFLHKFGKDMSIIVVHVTDIPRETSGKYKLIVNKLRD